MKATSTVVSAAGPEQDQQCGNLDPDNIRKILSRDALAEAEKVTGVSYKESRLTEALGFFGHIQACQARENAMLATGDTMHGDKLHRYIEIATSIGFRQVLDVPFVGQHHGGGTGAEHFFVFWRDGILLAFDTYGRRVNSGKFYYNWCPNGGEIDWRLISSGSMPEPGLWAGDHDCREALKFHIAELERGGSFLSRWRKRPFLWLLHWMDTKEEGYDYKAITESRIAMLPENVRDAITPDESGK